MWSLRLLFATVPHAAQLCNLVSSHWLNDRRKHAWDGVEQSALRALQEYPNTNVLNLVLAESRATPIYKTLSRIKNELSMLHSDILFLLYCLAKNVTGSILEIGPYVGGSTIAMCHGVRDSRAKPFLSIEAGGAHPAHPTLPSRDIAGDLANNLSRYGMARYVRLLHGRSADPCVVSRAGALLRDTPVELLFIDTDGEVQRDFDLYLRYCRPGCAVVIDDYSAADTEAALKTEPTRAAIDSLTAQNRLVSLGVYGWGTWVGIFRG
jgi:predicted O-methyltransferase YrrM